MDLSVNWNSVFEPAIGISEIVVRGSIMRGLPVFKFVTSTLLICSAAWLI
jgi:hypothetical protein